ncbi:MAG: polysaccharide deacetylase family protein [Clostridia bacterium]|nr:polysaccharide deacetylase family protein [Clostridia bacterium]
MKTLKDKRKYFRRACCLLFVVLIAMNGCSSRRRRVVPDDDFGKDEFVPVMANPHSSTTNKTVSGKKRVALTLDDGPHNVYTKKIVDELSKYGYHATFFVVGNRVNGPEYNGASAMIYAYEKGNEIAIHGFTHTKYYDTCTAEEFAAELSKTKAAITNNISGANVSLVRPVGGKITGERIQNCEYSVIMWSVDSLDWQYKTKSSDDEATKKEKIDTIVENVMSSVRDGSVILMHDIYESTYESVAIILKELHEQGYEVVTVSELFGDDLKAGAKYSSK